jgi:hypothetical protein
MLSKLCLCFVFALGWMSNSSQVSELTMNRPGPCQGIRSLPNKALLTIGSCQSWNPTRIVYQHEHDCQILSDLQTVGLYEVHA